MPNPSELRQQITNQIVAALEQNTIPWRRPWSISKNAGRPANALSQRAYTGINPLLLQLHAEKHGFQSKWHGTFQQWQQLGCTVKRRPEGVDPGAWGCKIIVYKPLTKTVIDEATGDEDERDFRLMKTYSVFNAEQVEGEAVEKYLVGEVDEGNILPNFEPFEELVAATKADIRHGGEKAFYERPQPLGSFPNHTHGDRIEMPERRRFESMAAYYETLAHELAHHSECRLGWEGSYALGELIAEMSATFVCQELSVPNGGDLTNHASYLQSWIAAMKGDSSFIFKASTQASKVADFLLSFVRKEQSVELGNKITLEVGANS